MTDNFFRRLSGVSHKVVSGLAGKPSAVVNIHLPGAPLAEPISELATESDAQQALAPESERATSVKLGDWALAWADLVRLAAKEERADHSDLWALLHCRSAGEHLQIVTALRKTFIAAISPDVSQGPVNCYVRLLDLDRLIRDKGHSDVRVGATHLTYSRGAFLEDIPYAQELPKTVVHASAVPTDGYIPAKGLWLSLHEAFKFALPEHHARGLHAVHVHPLRDGTNQVAVYGIGDTEAYRRILTIPGLRRPLTILPRWAFRLPPPSAQEDTLGVLPAGVSYVWLRFPSGIVVGEEMPSLGFPANVNELFSGLDGRVDFTPDEVATFRRSVLRAKPVKLGPGGAFDAVGIRPESSSVVLRGSDDTAAISARGDAGEEILVDPDLLGNGLAVKDILSLEFAKGDPESRFRLVGRDVAVAIQPLDKEE